MSHYISIESKYSSHGLTNNKLNNLKDLDKVHNIDITQILGFKDLDYLNQQMFTKFIINYYNAQGLEIRDNLQPIGIYCVEDTCYLVQEDGYLAEVMREIYKICKNGEKEILRKYVDEEYIGSDIQKITTKNYLRFEFEEYNRPIWLHVKDENAWY